MTVSTVSVNINGISDDGNTNISNRPNSRRRNNLRDSTVVTMGNLTGIITFWYIDHESNNNFLTDINVLMSEDDNNNYCYYICYTFNTDPITCDNNWYKYNNYLNTNSIIIKSNQCIVDTFPTAPTSSTFAPGKSVTKTLIIAANNIHKSICLSNDDGSLDGTFSNRQIFIKKYLPKLKRSFLYFALMEPFCVCISCGMVAVFYYYYIFSIISIMVCSITIIIIGGNHIGIDCMFIDERKTKLYLFPVIQHQIPFTHSNHLYCTGSQSLLHMDNPLDVYKRDIEIEMPILFDFNENNYISVCYYNVINNKITNKNENFKAIISDNVHDTPIAIAYNTKTNVLLTIACTYTHIRNIIIYYLYTQQDGQQKEVMNKVNRAKAFHQPQAYNYAKTTAHLDIIDAVNAIINKENKILFSYCKFQIAMKSSLNGMASCRFALNCKSGIDLQDKRTNKTKLQFDFSSMIGGRDRNGSGYMETLKQCMNHIILHWIL